MALVVILAAGIPTSVPLAAEPVTHLFTSWYGIDAGTTVHKVNRNNVDPESMKVIEQVKDRYHQTLELADGNFAPERISVPTGVRLRAEVATKSEPWLVSDRPWETAGVYVQRVIHVNGVYRVWYSASEKSRDFVKTLPNGKKKLGSEEGGGGLCYMESKDGINWVKPSLGLVDFHGSK